MNKNPAFSQESVSKELLTTLSTQLKQDRHESILNHLTIVKRNGMIVPFNQERIKNALESAFRDTKSLLKPKLLPDDLIETLDRLVEEVVKQAVLIGSMGASLSVEGIQDLVEITLMKNGFHDVARDYIIYRDHHKTIREDSIENVKILRKDGTTLVRFNPVKISKTIESLFRKATVVEGQITTEHFNVVNEITQSILDAALKQSKITAPLSLHQIQDFIENGLMKAGYYEIAKDYIVHRYVKGEQTPKLVDPHSLQAQEQYEVTLKDGSTQFLNKHDLEKRVQFAATSLKEVDPNEILEETIKNFYPGIKENEIDLALIMAARVKIEKEPAYTYVASRFLLDIVYRESLGTSFMDPDLEQIHRDQFKQYIKFGIQQDRLNEKLLTYDLDWIASKLDMKRDHLFEYIGLQTLYDRYFIHHEKRRIETPQYFWMRVAMGLAWNEENKNIRAVEFYDILSTFQFVSSTPTLFNSGTSHPQLSSCYLSTIMDDLHHIFKVIADDAQLSKWAGGIGNDWSNVRATGSRIKGTNGESQGVIPFLKVANDTAVAVNQCFAPETAVLSAKGIVPISEINKGDLVLGISGSYREVTDKFIYEQKDRMVEIQVEHSLAPIKVTANHPFYAIQNIDASQSKEKTEDELKKGTLQIDWIDAEKLNSGDLIAQVIPQEISHVEGLDEEDARFYGILLGCGNYTPISSKWILSSPVHQKNSIEFIRSYLKNHQIEYEEKSKENSQITFCFSLEHRYVCDATTGHFSESISPSIVFESSDFYNENHEKQLAPRLAHLPKNQTVAMLQGLVESSTYTLKDTALLLEHESLSLIEGIRYQFLRFAIPVKGTQTKSGYTLNLPLFDQLANQLDLTPISKKSWIEYEGFLLSPIESVKETEKSPFVCDLKVEGDESYMITAALAHNGGKRKGAMCAYLETWHLDIEDFLELRKNTGDERRRTHDMNTANWIPDLFMQRVESNQEWTLFSPADTPDLHDLYGQAFAKRYQEYEKLAAEGKIKLHKKVDATTLWRKMLSMLFETGHPWITFKDPSNIRSPQDHVGVVHSSNLCTEILLNTSKEETAVCNLGSINLPLHIENGKLDQDRLRKTVTTAIRMLDNVIDINFYPTQEAHDSNHQHRPIGLGLMGFQDALYALNLSYASHEAVQFADESMEMISYYAIFASSLLAQEKGRYASYSGSKWDRGYLPIDTIDLLEKERGESIDIDRKSRLDWSKVREHVQKYGMRNSNTMAIAPTATIANIAGVTSSIEPTYKNLYVKSNLSGEFTIPNTHLIKKLKQLNLWDANMLDDLKYYDGSILEIERIPEETKKIFLTAFEIDPEWIIAAAAKRQKWIDMGQSLNLYLGEPSGKKLHQMYFNAWKKGLKTTYYLRALAATQIEKSTMDINKRGLQPRWMKSTSASSNIKIERNDQIGKVCNLGEACESCQ